MNIQLVVDGAVVAGQSGSFPVRSNQGSSSPRTVSTSEAWGSFIRDGRPSSPQLPEWSRYERFDEQTMLLAPEPEVATHPHAHRLEYWSGIRTVPPLSS